jgi:integrase
VKHRLDEKAAHATVRQELAILGRMLTLAVRAGKLANRPPLPLVEVRNTRTGFFTTEQLRAVTAALPEHLRPLVQFASITGWRRAECLGLMWNRVDFGHGQVRLEPGTTKNLAGRMWPFGEHPALAAVLMEQHERTQALQRERGVVIPWVFHRDGKKITTSATRG